MKTRVVVTAGRRKGQVGFIAGELGKLNPHVTKTPVWFDDGATMAVIALQRLAPAGDAQPAQLSLAL